MNTHYIAVCSNCRFREAEPDKESAEDRAEEHRKAEPTHQVTTKEGPTGGAAEYPDRR